MNEVNTPLIRKTPFHLAVVLALGLLVYSNTFNVPFIFDDRVFLDSAMGKQLSDVPSMFTDLTGEWASRPLLHATLAVNYHLGGEDTTGYHAFNLALHLINALLLYAVVLMATRRLSFDEGEAGLAAFASSLLFVVHPAQTEAVTYIISRSMLMSTTFYLAGLILFHRAVTGERKKGLYLAGLFVVSLMGVASRENFATFPLMLFLYDALVLSGLRLKETVKHWRAYVPVALAFSYLAYIATHHTYGKLGGYGKDIPPVDYAITQLSVHWTYLRLLVFPINQTIDYDYPVAGALFEMPAIAAFVGYLLLLAAGIYTARRRPAITFAVLWFVVALLPVSFLVALADVSLGDVIFEHRLYLPSIGLIALAGVALTRLMRSPAFGKITVVAAVALVLSLGAAAYARNAVWSSGISLWGDAIEKAPNKARGYNNIAIFYRLDDRTEEAVSALEKVIRMEPGIPQTYYNLGNIHFAEGMVAEAEAQFLEAIRLRPEYVAARVNLGIIYKQAGQMDKAVEQYEAAVSYEPRIPDPYYNLANAYMRQGRYQDAVSLYQTAIGLDPNRADYHNNLSVAYRQLGLNDKADEEQRIAERLRGKQR